MEVRAALADDDLAGEDLLTAEALHAEALCVGVTTVTGGACALFVCHVLVSSVLLDAGDLDARELLAVALTLLVAGLVLVLLDDDLRAAEVADDLSRDGDLRQRVGVGGHRGAIDEQHGGQLDLVALGSLNTVELNDGADLDLLLPATGAHYCVNHFIPVSLGSTRLRESHGKTVACMRRWYDGRECKTLRFGRRGRRGMRTKGLLYRMPADLAK
ncbi:protein of unknown function [Microbacterium sp. Nx66]|nr:protein of unknown function [Microbacterium sp. Nx66]